MCKSMRMSTGGHSYSHAQSSYCSPSARSASEQQRPPPVPAKRRQPPPLLCATSPPFAPHSTLSVRTGQASSRPAACGSARRAGCPRRRRSPECPHTVCQLAVGLIVKVGSGTRSVSGQLAVGLTVGSHCEVQGFLRVTCCASGG